MPQDGDDTDTATGTGSDDGPDRGAGRSVFDRETLSDLSVNAVPVLIIAAFVLMFGLLSPGGDDPLVLFHGALIVGVLLVSYVSARIITGESQPLQGSAADPHDPVDSEPED